MNQCATILSHLMNLTGTTGTFLAQNFGTSLSVISNRINSENGRFTIEDMETFCELMGAEFKYRMILPDGEKLPFNGGPRRQFLMALVYMDKTASWAAQQIGISKSAFHNRLQGKASVDKLVTYAEKIGCQFEFYAKLNGKRIDGVIEKEPKPMRKVTQKA